MQLNQLIKEEIYVSGIYNIKNTVNNKIYIGSSINIYKRILKHRSLLRHDRHFNIILQNSYNKNLESDFIVKIIEVVPVGLLQKREQYFIDTLSPFYNISKEVICFSRDIDIRNKISETLKGNYERGYRNNCDKKLYVYNRISGEYLKEYPSITEACKSLGVSRKYIQSIIKNRNSYKYPYNFSFTKTDSLPPLLSKTEQKKVNRKKYIINDIIFYSLKEASDYYKVSYRNLRNWYFNNKFAKLSSLKTL